MLKLLSSVKCTTTYYIEESCMYQVLLWKHTTCLLIFILVQGLVHKPYLLRTYTYDYTGCPRSFSILCRWIAPQGVFHRFTGPNYLESCRVGSHTDHLHHQEVGLHPSEKVYRKLGWVCASHGNGPPPLVDEHYLHCSGRSVPRSIRAHSMSGCATFG